MKKLAIITACLFAGVLAIAGCGGGGGSVSTGAKVSGIVVGSDNRPIQGIRMCLNNKYTVTDSKGSFSFSNVDKGNYKLKGSGGATAHYVAEERQVQVTSGSNVTLGNVKAYKMYSVYYIEKNHAKAKSAALASSNRKGTFESVAAANSQAGIAKAGHVSSAADKGYTANKGYAAEKGFIDDNPSYVYVEWEKTTTSQPYKILLLGTNPSGSGTEIWSSDAAHPNDPAFNSNSPRAFLDLDDELYGRGIAGGNDYYIKITAGSFTYPVLKLSIANKASSFPENLSISQPGGTRQFTWTGAANSDGYQALVYSGSTLAWSSGSTLLTATSVNVPSGLTSGQDYKLYIDSHFKDDDGWTCEISSNMIWFTY